MKKVAVLATLAAGVGLLASPAMAQTGHFGLGYASAESNGFDADAVNVNGAVNIPTGGSLSVILDGTFTHNDDADVQSFGGTAHLVSRSDTNAFGGYVGLVDTDGSSAYVLGGEYAMFLSNGTVALGAGYGNVDDADVDLLGLNGEYRLFASDNLRFDFGAGWVNADGNGGDADILSLGVGGEYRLANSPISINGGYQRLDVSDGGGEVDVFSIGVKFDFGHDSLKSRDRSGSTTFGPLGGFGGALSLF